MCAAAVMGRALTGVETLFSVSAHDGMNFAQRSNTGVMGSHDREKQQTTAVDSSVAVGVQRIVYLSFLNAAADATFLLGRDHFHTEEHLRAVGGKRLAGTVKKGVRKIIIRKGVRP